MSPNIGEGEVRTASSLGPLEAKTGDAETDAEPRSFQFKRGLFPRLYPILTELWQLLDIAAVGVALYVVTLWRGVAFREDHAMLFVVTAALILLVYSWSDLFYRLRTRSLLQECSRLLQAWTIVLVLLMAIAFLAEPDKHFSPRFALQWGIAGFLAQLAVHITVRKAIHFLRRRGYNIRSALIVGCGAPLERHVRLINRNPWLGIQIEGYIAEPTWLAENEAAALTAASAAAGSHAQLRHLGGLADIERLVNAMGISEIYVALPLERSTDADRAMRALVNVPVNVDWLPDFSVAQVLSMRSDQIDGQPIVLLSDSRIERHGRLIKRTEDIVLSAILLILLSPVLLSIACLVMRSSPGPVLFKQSRHGIGGQRFVVWKFRTMRIEPQGQQKQATVGDDRVTPIGKLLRRWSLDELPQLFNVLTGHMSLVGPRPHPVWLNESYAQVIERYMARHRVKPGLTGWAQVNGFRGETDTREKMEQRVNCDLYYITHWSPWLDLKILARTVIAVFRGDNAY